MMRAAGLQGSSTPDLIAYGYETDGHWDTELAGVEPDCSALHWPVRFS